MPDDPKRFASDNFIKNVVNRIKSEDIRKEDTVCYIEIAHLGSISICKKNLYVYLEISYHY